MTVTSPPLPPAVVVHSLLQARLALAPGRPVTLLSAPGAAIYAGAGWWQQLIVQSGTAGPDLLDCLDAPGRALEALSLGCRGLVLHHGPAFNAVCERADGALVLPVRPAALDLADPAAARRIAAWLASL